MFGFSLPVIFALAVVISSSLQSKPNIETQIIPSPSPSITDTSITTDNQLTNLNASKPSLATAQPVVTTKPTPKSSLIPKIQVTSPSPAPPDHISTTPTTQTTTVTHTQPPAPTPVPAQSAPSISSVRIDSISPTSGKVGDTIIITGSGFGKSSFYFANPKDFKGGVSFYGSSGHNSGGAPPAEQWAGWWSDSQIKVKVPGVKAGTTYSVEVVSADGVKSGNLVSFTITE